MRGVQNNIMSKRGIMSYAYKIAKTMMPKISGPQLYYFVISTIINKNIDWQLYRIA